MQTKVRHFLTCNQLNIFLDMIQVLKLGLVSLSLKPLVVSQDLNHKYNYLRYCFLVNNHRPNWVPSIHLSFALKVWLYLDLYHTQKKHSLELHPAVVKTSPLLASIFTSMSLTIFKVNNVLPLPYKSSK